MNKGSQGTAELYDSTPPGLVPEKRITGPTTHKERGLMLSGFFVSSCISMNGLIKVHFRYYLLHH